MLHTNPLQYCHGCAEHNAIHLIEMLTPYDRMSTFMFNEHYISHAMLILLPCLFTFHVLSVD